MALIVEDGSLVDGANSYVSRADYIAYAATIGVTITDDVNADYQLVQAAEYIAQHDLKGTKLTRDQAMAYPRTDLYIDGWTWASDEIPVQVQDAQLEYALLINAGEDLYNRSVNDNQTVKREKVDGAVEVEYAVDKGTHISKQSKADLIMNSLVNSNGMSINLVRA